MSKFLDGRYGLIAVLLLAAFLRFWSLANVPPSLMGDELDLGYHAYSVLKTGKDYFGNPRPFHFQSLAEWRTPLYIYSAVPTVAIFGISPLGVRFPAAFFGVLGVWLFYLVVYRLTYNYRLALLSAFLLAVSPWHIQYSRAGFEVTQMLALYFAGLYFFLWGVKEGRFLWLASIFFALTPYAYSTAKLFLPLTLLAIVGIWWRDLLKLKKKHLIWACASLFLVGVPIGYSTFFGGGTNRFQYISIFSDPTTVPDVGFARLHDAKFEGGDEIIGVRPALPDRVFHNKFQWWGELLGKNYLEAFSTDFLFIKGDLNLRHSLAQTGEFYRFEIVFLVLGFVALLVLPLDRKHKMFIGFWLVAAPLPSAITRDGGMHATRLFFLLPPLVILNAFGVYYVYQFLVGGLKRRLFVFGYLFVFLGSFAVYQHEFWVHYPWDSERWWHAGFEGAIKAAVSEGESYARVIITTASQPPLIFFLAWSRYSPAEFQANYPLTYESVAGFGGISRLGKYYFGVPRGDVGVEGLSEVLDEDTLYLASAREVEGNLILEPEKKPPRLVLVDAIAYPSGEPAFYLFSKE